VQGSVLSGCKLWEVQRALLATPSSARVVAMAGTNDLLDLQKRKVPRRKAEQGVLATTRRLVRTLMQFNAAVCTIPPLLLLMSTAPVTVELFNGLLQSAASFVGLQVLDVHGAVQQDVRRFMGRAGVHLSPAGVEVVRVLLLTC
jgi:hypothetical protein